MSIYLYYGLRITTLQGILGPFVVEPAYRELDIVAPIWNVCWEYVRPCVRPFDLVQAVTSQVIVVF